MGLALLFVVLGGSEHELEPVAGGALLSSRSGSLDLRSCSSSVEAGAPMRQANTPASRSTRPRPGSVGAAPLIPARHSQGGVGDVGRLPQSATAARSTGTSGSLRSSASEPIGGCFVGRAAASTVVRQRRQLCRKWQPRGWAGRLSCSIRRRSESLRSGGEGRLVQVSVDALSAAAPLLLAQDVFLDLAGRGLGQVSELDRAG